MFFNLSLVLLSIFLALAIACAINLDSAQASLESLSFSQAEWNDRFSEGMTLASAQTLTQAFYIIGSVSCFVISTLLLVLFVKGI